MHFRFITHCDTDGWFLANAFGWRVGDLVGRADSFWDVAISFYFPKPDSDANAFPQPVSITRFVGDEVSGADDDFLN
jgi:hypothetical protein